MKPLELFVISGANGAGKSTLSQTFVPPGTDIFDGDKEMLKLKQLYSGTDSGTLYEAVNDIVFNDRKQQAIATGKDFAFETNFRTEDVMQTVAQFKEKGYQTNMIFLGLSSVEASINRVNMRVSAGGHYVDAENVNKNYTGGLQNLVKFYDQFDHVDILESSIERDAPFKITALIAINKGIIVAQAEKLPHWAVMIPKDIQLKQEIKVKEQLQLERQKQKEKKNLNKDKDINRGMSM